MPTRARAALQYRPLFSPEFDFEVIPAEPLLPELPLAKALIEKCEKASPSIAGSALRASCLAARMAQRMLWPAEIVDIAHLACLGRQDVTANRERWATLPVLCLAMVAKRCLESTDILQLMRLALLAERLVREEGVFHGMDALMRQRAPDEFLDAAWDLRYDEASWVRLDLKPAHEALLYAGSLGLSAITYEHALQIPIPIDRFKSAA